MSGYEITCANKNPQGMIVRIGGAGWTLGIHDAILKVMTKQLRLNIYVGNQQYDIGVRGDGADAYLALEPDGRPLHEIELLRSC